MKKYLTIWFFLLFSAFIHAYPQNNNDTTVYLITCAPGTETYSVYGHSALRVVINHAGTDMVYNWGVFDFSTPNFTWKFAKGRLNYLLGVYPYNRFLQDYMLENRSVYSQKVNLEPVEKLRLMILLGENMKPENRYYRYDFFYDDCSTRIRDIFEKILGSKLIYPPDQDGRMPSFREMISQYTRMYPWLKMGIDLLMGTPGDQKADFRERMFLPYDLKLNLTQAVINRDRRMIPLLQNTETVLDFPPPDVKRKFYFSPAFVFTILFILIVLISAKFRVSRVINYIDIALFLFFSLLALMMIFFNFFTDHQQMKMNLNILWFNPFIILCLAAVIFNREGLLWFRIVFVMSLVFIPLILVFPHGINSSFVPVVIILLLRSSARAGFTWNPLAVEPLNA